MCNAHPVVKPNLVMNCSSVDAYCMCNWWRVIVYLKPTSTLCYSHIVHLRSLWLKAYVNMSHFQSMRHFHQSYKSDSSPVGEHLKPHCTPECFLSCFMLIAHSFGPWKCSQRIPHCQQKFDILPWNNVNQTIIQSNGLVVITGYQIWRKFFGNIPIRAILVWLVERMGITRTGSAGAWKPLTAGSLFSNFLVRYCVHGLFKYHPKLWIGHGDPLLMMSFDSSLDSWYFNQNPHLNGILIYTTMEVGYQSCGSTS